MNELTDPGGSTAAGLASLAWAESRAISAAPKVQGGAQSRRSRQVHVDAGADASHDVTEWNPGQSVQHLEMIRFAPLGVLETESSTWLRVSRSGTAAVAGLNRHGRNTQRGRGR